VNADKTKYMIMSRNQDAGRSHNIKTDISFFESVEQLKYMGTALTQQNYIHEKIKSRLKSGNAWYHSVQIFLSSGLLSRNIKLRYTYL
jgi:hypothetical protein